MRLYGRSRLRRIRQLIGLFVLVSGLGVQEGQFRHKLPVGRVGGDLRPPIQGSVRRGSVARGRVDRDPEAAVWLSPVDDDVLAATAGRDGVADVDH